MKAFYDRDATERVGMTEAAIRERRTLLERWIALTDFEGVHWNARSALAAELLRDQSSVVDFGCGMMYLEKYLSPHQKYIPSDVTKRDDRTLVCDLNEQNVPVIDATAVCLLGVLEYIHDVANVLRCASQVYDILIASYCITDAPDAPSNRREHAWVNDFDSLSFEKVVHDAGWHVDQVRTVDSWQKMWRLRSTTPRRSSEPSHTDAS